LLSFYQLNVPRARVTSMRNASLFHPNHEVFVFAKRVMINRMRQFVEITMSPMQMNAIWSEQCAWKTKRFVWSSVDLVVRMRNIREAN